MQEQLERFKILTPLGNTYFFYASDRTEAIKKAMKQDNTNDLDKYILFDSIVRLFDLSVATLEIDEPIVEPEPQPASGKLYELENMMIVKFKKNHTDQSLELGMKIATIIDKYKRYGYTEYNLEDLEELIYKYYELRNR